MTTFAMSFFPPDAIVPPLAENVDSALRSTRAPSSRPLLTGERGHYELAAGRDPALFIRTMERFASSTGFLPEQVWDESRAPPLSREPDGCRDALDVGAGEYIKPLRFTALSVFVSPLPFRCSLTTLAP